MISKNSNVHFLKDYLINFKIRPLLLDTNEIRLINIELIWKEKQ